MTMPHQPPSPQTSGPGSLLRLPPELRQEIFRYVIAPLGYAYLYNTPGTAVRRPCSMIDLTLMLVSRSVRADAEEVLYSHTTFVVEICLWKRMADRHDRLLSEMVSDQTLKQIRRLAFVTRLDTSYTPGVHTSGFESMTGVRHVDIAFIVNTSAHVTHDAGALSRMLLPIRAFIHCMPATARVHIGVSNPLMHRLMRKHRLRLQHCGHADYSETVMHVAQQRLDWMCRAQGSLSGRCARAPYKDAPDQIEEERELAGNRSCIKGAMNAVYLFCDIALGVPIHLLIGLVRFPWMAMRYARYFLRWCMGSTGELMLFTALATMLWLQSRICASASAVDE